MSKLKVMCYALGLKLPRPLLGALMTGRLNMADGRRADPQAQVLGEMINTLRGDSPMPSVEQSRRQLDALAARLDLPCPDNVTKRDVMLPGGDGDRPARIYQPQAGENLATLLFLHGGGWVQGSIASHDGMCGRLAEMAGIRVISYDYRLAPEHLFPAGPDDVLACYLGLLDGVEGLDITPDRLIVGGDSAGGNLTAVLMHDLRAQGAVLPKGQLLIYPAMDATLASQSMQTLENAYLLPVSRISWFLEKYLPAGQDPRDPRVSPLFSEYLAGQPQAMIFAGGHDPLWDDAQSYAAALQKAGVAVEQDNYPGQIHVFMSATKVLDQGNQALENAAKWLKSIVR